MNSKTSNNNCKSSPVTVNPDNDRAFVKLVSAILEEPEEVILAAVLAKKNHKSSALTH